MGSPTTFNKEDTKTLKTVGNNVGLAVVCCYAVVEILSFLLNKIFCDQEEKQQTCFVFDYVQNEESYFQTMCFYIRMLLTALSISCLLTKEVVSSADLVSTSHCPKEVSIACVTKSYNTRINQTTHHYMKKRNRTLSKLAVIRDKTIIEMEKVYRKKKLQNRCYWFKDLKVTKELNCREQLIGGLELRRSSLATHITQLQYNVIYSRDQLEIQRERNKTIQDNIDQFVKFMGVQPSTGSSNAGFSNSVALDSVY